MEYHTKACAAGMLAVGIFADPAMAAEVFTVDSAYHYRLTGAIYVRFKTIVASS